MNKRFARIFALSLVVMLTAGCATASLTQTASPAQAAAIALLEQGKSREAAQQLEAQAATASGAQRSRLLADAAFAWNEAGDAARARSLLAQVTPRQLSGDEKGRYQLLSAEFALADKQPAQALQALGGNPPQGLSPAYQARWHLVRGKALEANGNPWEAAGERSRADAALTGQVRGDNQREIMRLLASLDDNTLRGGASALPAGDPLYNFAGRALLNRGLPLPRPFDRAQWSFDTSKRPPADRDGYRPPVKLAVLLPLTGTMATAAAPVRDGLLAGYYAESRHRPQIEFLDTAGTAGGATAAYERAVAGGADYVVGPLGRDEVSALFARADLAVPVLALNRPADSREPPAGSAGFSLAPEDDGIMAAEFLLQHGQRNALVVATSDDNGRRAAQAFRERMEQRGGKVAGSVSVAEVPGDVSAQLRNYSVADSVFLAVRGPTARALTPQLAMAGLAGKPRVGTSQLVLGTGKPEEDMALDGIAFPAERWSSTGVAGLPSAATVATTLPTARGPAARLFAFGYDAWLIAAFLEPLAKGAEGGLRGATGTLYLDGFGNVLRSPAWATFSGGRAMPVAGSR